MRRVSSVLAATALLLLTSRAIPGKGKTGLDEEGFITTWLLLAPGKVTEDSVAYAVCYIHTDAALPDIQLRTGSDDQAVVYLNGKQVLKQTEDRELTKDDDITDVSLQKGVNVLVFKVVNEKEDWSGCARFTDKNGQVIKKLKVTSAPE